MAEVWHTIVDLPLNVVVRPEIALPLQQFLKLQTVGQFIRAWRNPRNQKSIEQLFDTPEQARNAAQICYTWVGASNRATIPISTPWWVPDEVQ